MAKFLFGSMTLAAVAMAIAPASVKQESASPVAIVAAAAEAVPHTPSLQVRANAQAGAAFLAPVEPNRADGRPILQVGVDNWSVTNIEEPFVNWARKFGNNWTAVKAGAGGETMEMAALMAAGYIDRETLLPKAIPPGFDFIRSGLFRFGARHDPVGYAGRYIIEWDGDAAARIALGCAGSQKHVATNRIEINCRANDRAWTQVQFTVIGPGGLKAVRIFRPEDEAEIRAGATFRRPFLDYCRRYKVLRTLSIQDPNRAAARSVDRLTPKAAAQWGASPALAAAGPGSGPGAGLPMGPPMEALFDLAVACDAALWMHVAGPIGAPPVFDDIAVTGPRRGEVRERAVENAAAIVASQEWDRYADEVVRSLIASGYPATRALYIETGNEVWSNAFPFWWYTNYFLGIRDWVNTQTPVSGYGSMVGAGFMEARFADALDRALARAGRKQAVVFVLACQHANTATCESVITGFKQYFVWAGIAPGPFLARAGLSTATYFSKGIANLFPGATDDEKAAAWRNAIAADPAGTAKALTDWYLSADTCCSIPYLVRMRKAHTAIAARAGIAFIGDYEGEDHDQALAPLRNDAAFEDWYLRVWLDGPDGERLTREWLKALYADNPDAIIANFSGIAKRSVKWPWGDGLYGEDTGRRRVLDEFLRQ